MVHDFQKSLFGTILFVYLRKEIVSASCRLSLSLCLNLVKQNHIPQTKRVNLSLLVFVLRFHVLFIPIRLSAPGKNQFGIY